jgi:hypothetical protein
VSGTGRVSGWVVVVVRYLGGGRVGGRALNRAGLRAGRRVGVGVSVHRCIGE